MTFGEVKSIIEKNLFESYKDNSEFKKMLREFKYYVLNDKKMSRLYSLYDQLSTPQGLSEIDAKEFLDEGLELIQKTLSGMKLPETKGFVDNQYQNIDLLVYSNKADLKERIESKKGIINKLMTENVKITNRVTLPLDSMVKIANQTIGNYMSTLDESTKKELIELINEDSKNLKFKYDEIKESTLSKLKSMLNEEENSNTKTKIVEVIDKLEGESFDVLNYFRLKNLSGSL